MICFSSYLVNTCANATTSYFFIQNFQRHLTSRAVPNEDGDDKDAMPLEQIPEEVAPPPPPEKGKRGRKRKNVDVVEEVRNYIEYENHPYLETKKFWGLIAL